MWLFLSHANDDTSAVHKMAHGLEQRGLRPLHLITDEELAFCLQWEHRVTTDTTSTRLRLKEHLEIDSESIAGVLNRLTFPHPGVWYRSPAVDRDYVLQELNALYLSWLHSIPGVVLNPATARGLSGTWYTTAEWHLLAARAGLATPVYKFGVAEHLRSADSPRSPDLKTVIVVNEDLCGPAAPPAVLDACLRLVDLARTPLLGIRFTVGSESEWTFHSATPVPDFADGGSDLLDILAAQLCQRG